MKVRKRASAETQRLRLIVFGVGLVCAAAVLIFAEQATVEQVLKLVGAVVAAAIGGGLVGKTLLGPGHAKIDEED